MTDLNKGKILVAKFLHLNKGRNWKVVAIEGHKARPFTREVKPDWIYHVLDASLFEKWDNDVKGYSLQHSAEFIVDSNGEITKCRMAGPVEAAEIFEYNELERILYEQRD